MSTLALIAILFFSNFYNATSSNLSKSIQTRVHNGKPANRKDFPYMARLIVLESFDANYAFSCGGTLISNRHILTGAHCLFNCKNKKCLNHIIVFLGDIDKNKMDDKNRKMFKVKREDVIIHKGYRINYSHPDNDIAIVPLPKNIEFNDYIQPAKLPSRSQGSLLGKVVEVSGWGLNGKEDTNVLLHTQLKIVAHENCNIYKSFVPTLQLCAQGSSSSTCVGDSGGPFVIKNKKGLLQKTTYTVVGVLSYGSMDCTKHKPEAITNVYYYLDWIHEHTGIEIRK